MRKVLFLAALAMSLAGCSGAATTQSTTSTLQVIDVTTSTTVAETTTTIAATTTTTPPPVSGIIATSTGLAGWWDGADWVSAEVSAPPLQRDSEYQFVYLNDPITTQPAGEITTDEDGICATPSSGLQFPGQDNWMTPSPIAVSADWDLRPHRIELLGTTNKTYENETKRLLPDADTKDFELVQVIRTDLEGDGTLEVIVTAQSISDTTLINNKVGEFSIVFLRKVINDEVQTAVLHSFVVESFNDFEFGFMAPAYVSAIADLNGDGKMEIVLDSFYYEGRSTAIYEYINNDLGPVAVLGAGCGA